MPCNMISTILIHFEFKARADFKRFVFVFFTFLFCYTPCPKKIRTNSNAYISYTVHPISMMFSSYELTVCKNVCTIFQAIWSFQTRDIMIWIGGINNGSSKLRSAYSMRAPNDLVNWLDMTSRLWAEAAAIRAHTIRSLEAPFFIPPMQIAISRVWGHQIAWNLVNTFIRIVRLYLQNIMVIG